MMTSPNRSARTLRPLLALVGALLLASTGASCKPEKDNPDTGTSTKDGGHDGGHDPNHDGGNQPDGSMGDDGGLGDGGCVTNPRTPQDIPNGCTTSFRIPVNRTPPCAVNGVPGLGTDLPAGCYPDDAGPGAELPDGSTCYVTPDAGPDAGVH